MRIILCFFSLLLTYTTIFAQSCKYTQDHNSNIGSTHVSCAYNFSNSCINLTANFPTIKDSYTYSQPQQITYNPIGNYNEGTALNANDDDRYIKQINFTELGGEQPFLFHFYGSLKSSLVISTNGIISFNNNITEGDFSTPDANNYSLPSVYLPQDAIYGIFQDLEFSNTNDSEIYYNLIGEYPCRKLIINYYKGRLSGTYLTSTFQIVLNERTGIIEINIDSKPLAASSMRFKNALVGINGNSTNGIAAPNRNTGNWQATNESYIFTPNGNTLSPTNYKWTNNINNTITNSPNVNVCNIVPSIYTATARYTNQNGEAFSITQNHPITFDNGYPLPKNYSEVICNTATPLQQSRFYSNINSQTNHSLFRYKFYLNNTDAQNNNTNFIPINQNLQAGQTYYVRIENASNSSCFKIAILQLRSQIEFPTHVEICDAGNDRTQEYVLTGLNCQLFNNVSNASNIRYFIDGQTTPSTTAILTANTRIRVQYNLPGCTNLMSSDIRVNFIDGPNLLMQELNFESYEHIFDIITNNNPIYEEPFIWKEELEELRIILSNDENITNIKAFTNLNDAINNRNVQNRLKEGLAINDYRYILYLRIENESEDCRGFCYNILPVNARIKFKRIILNINDTDPDNPVDDPTKYDEEVANIYLCANDEYEVNLITDMRRIFNLTSTNYSWNDFEITFHRNYGTANNLENEGIEPIQQISGNGATFYVRLVIPYIGEIDPENSPRQKYIVKPLVYTLTPTTPLIDKIDVCVDYTINEKLITLSNYFSKLLPTNILNLNPTPIIEFYSDQNATNQITQLNATRNYQRIWVKIKFQQTDNNCEQINPLDIRLIANEGILKSVHEVNITCDNNNDQQENVDLSDYITEFVQTPENYSVKYFRNYNATTNVFSNEITNYNNFTFNQNTTIYVQLIQNNTGNNCYQKLEIKLNYNINQIPQINLEDKANLLLCNEANQTHVIFNLENAITQLYLRTNNPEISTFITSIKYYENIADATLGNNNTIANPQTYQLLATTPDHTIYIRFESTYGCFSIAPIHLSIIGIIKLKNNISVNVCDQNLDGIYDFNFREWINNLTQDSETDNDLLTDPITNRLANYRIYLTQTDYNNGTFLTPEQEINFILNPLIHTTFIIEAIVEGGCQDHILVRFNYATPIQYNYQITPICDDLNNGFELIDLTQFESNFTNSTFKYYRNLNDLNNNLNEIESSSNYNFDETLGDTIYFKIFQNGNLCPDLGTIQIKLNKVPYITIDDILICPETEITITPNDTEWEITNYNWEDANGNSISNERIITLSEPGIYRLTLTSANGCTYTEEFEINHYDLPTFVEISFQQNSATIIASGNGTILYSIDNINWQTSNIFDDLLPGIHNFYVKIENENCVVGPFDGVIPNIPNTISPNGDSINDFWVIKNLHVFNGQSAKLEIFDRFGFKLFSQESSTEFNWNGKKDGKPLPSTSYWYIIELPDGRKYTGYINVINKY